MKIVYIAHPIGGDIKNNLSKIIDIIRQINLEEPEIIPFAHYWVDCHALNDNIEIERNRGIKNDVEFFNRKIIDELRLYGDKISKGMKAEISLCHRLGIPIKPMTVETLREYSDLCKEIYDYYE